MNSLQFEKRQLKYLASLIKSSPKEILYICDNIETYYSKRVEIKLNKVTGQVKAYSDGTPKTRTIRPSYRRLKELQRNIKKEILERVPLTPHIFGGVKGKNNILNAVKHRGHKFVLTTDLQDFYPTISHKDIYNLFLRLGFSNHIAHWLTKLTSIEFELPQGTRTSTHIANLIFSNIDSDLIKFCDQNDITYTRFVDDLTFSSQNDFQSLIPTLLSIILKSKFKISWRKTIYRGNQNITGVDVFANYVDAPLKIKQKLKRDSKGKVIEDPVSRYVENIRKKNPKALTKEKQRITKVLV